MSKIRYATLFAVVLVGCSRENEQASAKEQTKLESKIESEVSVVRRIEVKDGVSLQPPRIARDTSDELLYAITTWSMTLRPRGLSFNWVRASAGGGPPDAPLLARPDRPKTIRFSDPKEATDALAKFVEWDEKARQNNVEPFREWLANECTFEFVNGVSTLWYLSKVDPATFNGSFSRDDVDKFNELLKQLPEAKAELEDKIAKAKKEAALFK